MRKMLLLLLVGGIGQIAQAETVVCRWVDEADQVHYTDQFVKGCEALTIPDAPASLRPAVRTRGAEATLAKQPDEPVYKSLRIVSPREDEAWRRLGDLPFRILVEIDLAPQQRQLLQEADHRLLVSIDGERQEFEAELQDGSLALLLTDVFRGTHQVQVTVEDGRGKEFVASQVVNFHVLQISPIIRRQQQEQLRKRVQGPTSPPSS